MSAFCSCTRCLAIFRRCWDLYVSKITETHRLIPSHTPTTMKLTKNTAVTGLGTARAPSPPPPTASAGRMTSGKFSVVMSTVIATDASNALSKFPRVSASATSYRPWYSCTPSADHATTTVPTRDTVGANLGMVFNALDTNWRSGRTCATSNSGRRHRVGRDRSHGGARRSATHVAAKHTAASIHIATVTAAKTNRQCFARQRSPPRRTTSATTVAARTVAAAISPARSRRQSAREETPTSTARRLCGSKKMSARMARRTSRMVVG